MVADQVAGNPSLLPLSPVRWEHTCIYCLGRFRPWRWHARTCSTACRMATKRARGLESYAHVYPASCRRSSWSAARARATGAGWMTAEGSYLADLRVRALAGEVLEHADQRRAIEDFIAAGGEWCVTG